MLPTIPRMQLIPLQDEGEPQDRELRACRLQIRNLSMVVHPCNFLSVPKIMVASETILFSFSVVSK